MLGSGALPSPASGVCAAGCTLASVVGCDGVVGSGCLEDRCTVCNGTGVSCPTHSGTLCTCGASGANTSVCERGTAASGGTQRVVRFDSTRNVLGSSVGGAIAVFCVLLVCAGGVALAIAHPDKTGDRKQEVKSVGRFRSMRILARKNLQIKSSQYTAVSCGCCPCAAVCELPLPVGVIVLFAYLRGLSDTETTLGGWEIVAANGLGMTRQNIPMSDMSATTATTSFLRSMMLPLHLRPQYKLALAARRPEDVAQVESFRSWVAENWFPRQYLPVVPCLPTQHERYRGSGNTGFGQVASIAEAFDEHRRLQRRQLHSMVTPHSRNVVDLAEHYTWEDIEQKQEDWLPTCETGHPYHNTSTNASWDCGTSATTEVACAAHAGCTWWSGTCVQSSVFPSAQLCCSRVSQRFLVRYSM